MAFTSIPNSVVPQKWLNAFVTEYARGNYYDPFMGKGSDSVIMKIDGMGRSAGDTVNIPVAMSRSFHGVEDCAILEGNETAGFFTNQTIKLKLVRDAEVLQECTTWKTSLDLFEAIRARIMNSFKRKLNVDINEQLKGVVVPGTGTGQDRTSDTIVLYANSTAAQRNTFLVNNRDRIVAGSRDVSAATTWSTVLDSMTLAADRFSASVLQAAVAKAENTDVYDVNETEGSHVAIQPITVDADSGEESYVAFLTPRQYRDAFNDPMIYAANKDAGPRSDNNRIFKGGSLMYYGVVLKKVPTLTGLGANAGGVLIDAGFLCGQRAAAVAWAQSPTPIMNDRDYGSTRGVGLKEIRGQAKIAVYGKQASVVTMLTATTSA